MPKNPLVYALFLCAALLVTVSGLLVYEKDARARAETHLAREQAQKNDVEQIAEERRLSLLSAEDLIKEATEASIVARKALMEALEGDGTSLEDLKGTLIVELQKGGIAPWYGFHTKPVWFQQATAALKAQPKRQKDLNDTLAREAKAIRGLDRSKRATKFWSKLTILTGGALAIVLIK